jgi:hypothetical protein
LLPGLDRTIALPIRNGAALAAVRAHAQHLGIDPVSSVIGLIAKKSDGRSATAILRNTKDEELTTLTQILCLN